MKPKKDPVKYRKLVNQFNSEWVEKSKNTSIQIVDSAQNFSIWLDKEGYSIKKVGIINKLKNLILWLRQKK